MSRTMNMWDLETEFVHNTKLTHVEEFHFWGLFPALRRVWTAQKLLKRLLETNIVEEWQVKRGPNGTPITVFFRELPKQEHIEIACLGFEGIEKLDKLIREGKV